MALASERVSNYLRSQIELGVFPGAQYVIGQDGEVVAEGAVGWAVIEPERVAVNLDTIYDVASLTKPLVTALLAVIMTDRGLIDLRAPVAQYLNEFDTEDKRHLTLIDLLTHRSGLPAWRALYLETTLAEVVPAIARLPLEPSVEGGSTAPVVYGDLNYILVGYVLERVAGARLDRLARREIFDPLGLQRTMFNPPPELTRLTAATELGRNHERVTVGQPSVGDERLVWGEVHDGNAQFLGGVSGHAGLFSTAREVFIIANQFLRDSRLISRRSLELFRTNFTPDGASHRSIGWLLATTDDCSAGPMLSKSAFGHTGFTGTSVWIEPDPRRVLVLLTNRVHPHVGKVEMKEPRRQFNSLAVEELASRS
ncbi:MAG TPA: serine hydrolase domain-containing protein [Blastocatellia bacterium]|nr:serine hydrolase domain-containing protein [Blastocatellia bacterium]